MQRSQRRLIGLLVALPLLLVLLAGGYMVGMERLEGEPRGFWQSLEWAAETLSTTGYGSDALWRHPLMVLFVVTVQFAGVFLVFLVVPIYLIPFLEERFERRAPRDTPAVSGHLVVYRHGPAVETLLRQVARAGLAAVVVEEDEALARRLAEQGLRVVWGRLEEDLLQRAHLASARALIANGSDHDNAVAILAARQLGFGGEILALVEDPMHRPPMVLAGAHHVFTPRHVLGAALAARASERISPSVSGLESLGRRLRVRELRIDRASPLAGRTIGEMHVGSQTGATLLGQWVAGRLVAPLGPGTRLEPRAVVIAAGSEESLQRLAERAGSALPRDRSGRFVVAGFGEVGRIVVELLRGAGEEVLVIDHQAQPGVDVVGNFLDAAVLARAELPAARAVVLALDSDATTLFAAVVVREMAPEATVIARVNQAANVERIHQAGADFALSISQVSGQILAHRLLGEEAVEIEPRLRVVGLASPAFDGRTPAELMVRERSGCSIVAVERGEELLLELPDGFRCAAGDRVYLCGGTEATRRARALFPAA